MIASVPHQMSLTMTPLIIFGDKSHTDLHGALAVTPIIVLQCQILETTSLIPNLGYGKNKADKTYTKDKVQNEVFLLHSNQFDGSIERKGSGHRCWAGK